jgi:hypothetical protein
MGRSQVKRQEAVKNYIIKSLTGILGKYIHTYIFIAPIQSLHHWHLNMKHVIKHQTTQDIKKHSQDKRIKQNKKHIHWSKPTPGHHTQWNNYMQ